MDDPLPEHEPLVFSAVDTLPINFAVLDGDGVILWTNRAWREFGRDNDIATAPDTIGVNYLNVTAAGEDETAERAAAGLAAVLEGDRRTFELEYPCHSPEKRRWFLMRVASFTEDDERYVAVAHIDITTRVRRERERKRFERAIEAAGQAVFITDPDGTITYVNPAFERMTGYEKADAVGTTPRILQSGEMSDDFYERLWTRIEAGDTWEGEIRNRRRSGGLYDAHQTIASLTDDDGAIEAYVAVQSEITEQKEREAQLSHYKRAIEGANDLIAAIDTDYRYRFANQAYREFHGLEADDVTGTPLSEGIGADTFETVQPSVERALSGRTVQYRMTRTRPDRPDRTYDIRYHPLEDEAGAVQGVLAVFRDLTEQVEREHQLASLDRLLRHNLRNELTVVRGHAEMIAEQAPTEVERHAAAIEAATERILGQTDKARDIVDVLTDPPEPMVLEPKAMIDRVLERLDADYPDATIGVDVSAETRLQSIPELERAIVELVENAIVHGDRDPPEVSVRVRDRDDTVAFTVTDDGPVIPPDERAVIVEDRASKPLLHCSGMGLWLVKRIVNRAGGTIRFSEAEPRGNEVTVVVPRDGAPV